LLKQRLERDAEQAQPVSRQSGSSDSDLMRALASSAAADPRLKIQYFIPHGPQNLEESSMFGWYTPGILATAKLIELAARLPADIREPYEGQTAILIARLSRRVSLMSTPVTLDALAQIQPYLPSPFQVFLTNNELVAVAVDDIASRARFPCLHLSSVAGAGRFLLDAVNLKTLTSYIETVLNRLEAIASWRDFAVAVREIWPGGAVRKSIEHSLPRGAHNVVTPNEVALQAFGWTLRGRDDVVKRQKIGHLRAAQYVNAICRSADAVYDSRHKLLLNRRKDIVDYRYIVAVSSRPWQLAQHWRLWIAEAEPQKRRALRQVFAWVVQAGSYFDSAELSRGTFKDLMADRTFQALMTMRAAEARAFTAGLSHLAANSLAPVLRLEPRLNRVRGHLKLLGECARARPMTHTQWKMSRMTVQLGGRMRASVNPEFLKRIDSPEVEDRIEGLKLVTDLPLELMPSDGWPLSMRFDVSRQPVMPGNLFIAGCVAPPRLVPLSAFKEILVLRSFKDTDPLRNILERAVNASLEANSPTFPVKVKFVDVQNKADLIIAINSFHGACMIFDGTDTVHMKPILALDL
jgi:hypothetical protein